jgi:anti-sigma-K factor RskA
MDYSRPSLADVLAAEYVAGTLRGAARRRFEALLPAHPALRAAVSRWQTSLMPLTASVGPQAPPAHVWKRIEARLDGRASQTTSAGPAPWWQRLGFWRAVSALAGVAVLALVVRVAAPPPAQAPIVVVLEAQNPTPGVATAAFVASISGDGKSVTTRPLVNVSVQTDRVLELWAAAGSGAPRSLGLISGASATVVRRASLPPGTDHLAVSLEPPGGSPTGAPTGPVLYVGRL